MCTPVSVGACLPTTSFPTTSCLPLSLSFDWPPEDNVGAQARWEEEEQEYEEEKEYQEEKELGERHETS